MPFQKGHKLNLGNKYASNRKWTPQQREEKRLMMLGNSHGFKKGVSTWNKGTKGLMNAWNKGKKFPEKCGINHWRWIADRTKLKRENRRGDPAYHDWRKQVWLRDNFKCKISNKDCLGRIEAHHILGWKDYPELRYEINNGITLCHYHHPRKRRDEKELAPSFLKLIEPIVSPLNLLERQIEK